MNRILIIVGMHRSGTSLTANWLQACGLFLGDEFVPADYSNPKGHFENQHFMDFHQTILYNNHLLFNVNRHDAIHISPSRQAQAQTMIRHYQPHAQWGWKDPRTTLFLDFWKQLLPDAKFLCVFRHYAGVVDSLLRRRWLVASPLKPYRTLNYVRHVPDFIHTWQRYNLDMLKFIERYPNDCLLLNIQSLLEHSSQVVHWINQRWGFDLTPLKINTVFDDSIFHDHQRGGLGLLCKLMAPEVVALERQLEAMQQILE